jgi:pilus assembly protein CpaF
MFGKRSSPDAPNAQVEGTDAAGDAVSGADRQTTGPRVVDSSRYEEDSRFVTLKRLAYSKLIEVLDPSEVLRLNIEQGRILLSRLLNDIVISERIQMTAVEERRLLNEIADSMLGFGPLERFLTEPDVSEIMVNGSNPIYVERNGVLAQTRVRFDDDEQLLNVCQRIASLAGRRVDDASPICDARLQDGSRVNVVIPPIAIDGPALTIRRFAKSRLTIREMQEKGAIPNAAAELLKLIAATRCNVLIVGGTGSGKTTLLNVLTAHIKDAERIVTCEDTAELQLAQPHVVRMETRPPNIEGRGEITMRDLVRNALRMRPDRIIVGEVRGPEAFDLMQAMNTGHDGSMGTVHANSPEEAITRVTSLITMGYPSLQPEVIQNMFASSVDVMVQVERMRDGSRKVTSITEVQVGIRGGIELNPVLGFEVGAVEDVDGIAVRGRHIFISPPRGSVADRADYYGEGDSLRSIIDALATWHDAQNMPEAAQ